ncbi:MAG: tRNA dihydrouridine synthase [Bacilli bacterium]
MKGRAVLAPMAGISFSSYRKFNKKFHTSFSYTEMVSDMGLIYNNKETLSYLKTDKNEGIVGLQLFGNSSENLLKSMEIALKINPNFAFIDVNMACPVNKVTSTGAGSSLLKDVDKIKEIITTLKSHTTLPVSIKIRLGIDENHLNYLDVISAAISSGVDFIALHARTKKQLYSGKPLYDEIRGLKDKVSVPLIISGDIFTVEDAIHAINITGADYVLVARGGIGNPLLIKEINYYFKTGKIKHYKRTINGQIKLCLKLGKMIIKDKGEYSGMRIYRGIAPKFFVGLPNSKNVKVALAGSLSSYSDLVRILKEYKRSFKY